MIVEKRKLFFSFLSLSSVVGSPGVFVCMLLIQAELA